jgi:hypothetical protein
MDALREVDDGEGPPSQYKSTPILVADGRLDRERVLELFVESSAAVPADIRNTVAELITGSPI